jgi:hypothetical protein
VLSAVARPEGSLAHVRGQPLVFTEAAAATTGRHPRPECRARATPINYNSRGSLYGLEALSPLTKSEHRHGQAPPIVTPRRGHSRGFRDHRPSPARPSCGPAGFGCPRGARLATVRDDTSPERLNRRSANSPPYPSFQASSAWSAAAGPHARTVRVRNGQPTSLLGSGFDVDRCAASGGGGDPRPGQCRWCSST